MSACRCILFINLLTPLIVKGSDPPLAIWQQTRDMDEGLSLMKTIFDRRMSAVVQSRSQEHSHRKRLPTGNPFNSTELKFEELECGNLYDISKLGYIFFKLNSEKEPCFHGFLGSKMKRCTVGFLCHGDIALEQSSIPDGACDHEWLTITDGTEGAKTGCGRFAFQGQSRVARNNETDLYIYFKGTSDSPCVAFCTQDLATESRVNILEPKQLAKKSDYNGLQADACVCGKRHNSGSIDGGGGNAFKFEFPWIGAVVFKIEGMERKPFCAGSLINDRYFVTAAHCFAPDNLTPKDIEIVLHMHIADKWESDQEYSTENMSGWDHPPVTDHDENSIRLEVEKIINHPLFDESTFDFDIALLKIADPLNLAEEAKRVSPICLPRKDKIIYYRDGELMTVAGWRRIREKRIPGARPLQKAEVLYLNLKECKKHNSPSNRHICAGFFDGTKDSCKGDSGGPLIYKYNLTNNQYILSGIVSAGEGCSQPQKGSFYTNVQELLQWIHQNTRDAIWCHR